MTCVHHRFVAWHMLVPYAAPRLTLVNGNIYSWQNKQFHFGVFQANPVEERALSTVVHTMFLLYRCNRTNRIIFILICMYRFLDVMWFPTAIPVGISTLLFSLLLPRDFYATIRAVVFNRISFNACLTVQTLAFIHVHIWNVFLKKNFYFGADF
jgi:hypothetical protein